MPSKKVTEKAPAPKSAHKKPTPVEITVSYSIGTKVNIGNYENVDVHVAESEKYDVTGMSVAEIEEFWGERYQKLHDRLGDLIIAEKREVLGGS